MACFIGLVLLAASVQPQAAVPAAYVHPTEVHIEYVSDGDHRATALGLASFAFKAVDKHPGFDLMKPDLWAGPGRYEIYLNLIIEGKKDQPHRVAIAWQVWYRDEDSIRQRAWISGLDQAYGTHDNLIHEGGVRVKHGIDSILSAVTKIDDDWTQELKKEYSTQSRDL